MSQPSATVKEGDEFPMNFGPELLVGLAEHEPIMPIHVRRYSENRVNANFVEYPFHALG
jgi:hypothetical protein